MSLRLVFCECQRCLCSRPVERGICRECEAGSHRFDRDAGEQ